MHTIIDDRTPAAKFRELTALAREAMARLHVPGLSIGLAVGDEEYVVGLGVTSVENPLPVTPETLFQIGSTTKTITSTALLRLVEEGRLTLDDRLRQYLPDFKVPDEDAAARVTIRHLLNHTAGWLGDFFINTGTGDDALAKYIEKMADIPQLTPLGTLYTYNNTSFNVAGRVIEVITGKTYEAAIREMVLEPLEMSNSFFFPTEGMLRRFVVGHALKEDNRVIVARPWEGNRSDNPCGGLVSDVYDQLRYARFHMGDGTAPKGERLLTPQSLQWMQTPGVPAGPDEWIGLNWFIHEIGGLRFVGHGGSCVGQQSAFWMVPEKKLAFTALTNLDKGTIINEELSEWVCRHFLNVVRPEPEQLVLSAQQLQEYCGRYVLPPTGDILEFTLSEGGLLMTHTLGDYSSITDTPPEAMPPMHAGPSARDVFAFTDGPVKGEKGEFLRGPDGRIAWLRFGGRVIARQ